jgi:hypothetical protein
VSSPSSSRVVPQSIVDFCRGIVCTSGQATGGPWNHTGITLVNVPINISKFYPGEGYSAGPFAYKYNGNVMKIVSSFCPS